MQNFNKKMHAGRRCCFGAKLGKNGPFALTGLVISYRPIFSGVMALHHHISVFLHFIKQNLRRHETALYK